MGILGDSNGPCPSEVNGKEAVLSGVLAIGLLGEYDGTNPLISCGKGAGTSGGNASEGGKFDPELPTINLH